MLWKLCAHTYFLTEINVSEFGWPMAASAHRCVGIIYYYITNNCLGTEMYGRIVCMLYVWHCVCEMYSSEY